MGAATVTPGSSGLVRARTHVASGLAVLLLLVGMPSAYCESAKGCGGDGRPARCVERIEHEGATGAYRPVTVEGPIGQVAPRTSTNGPGPIIESVVVPTEPGGGHWASGPPPSGRPLDRFLNTPLSASPRVYGRLSDRSARNIRLGYRLALQMVHPASACSALFEPFHAAAVESLASALYAAPTDREVTRICVGGVAAFTLVGSRVTKLCPEFGNLHPREAALTLIHETLHSAGMPESPSTPSALTSQEINALVGGACSSTRVSQNAEGPTVRPR